jgi:uncharacterized protein
MIVLAACRVAAGLAVPELTGRVVDQAGILSPTEEQRITNQIRQLERDTGGQMAVLTISSLEGEGLEAFSLRVANGWQIGSEGKDNGVLLLVSLIDRKMRLAVGRGWEKAITDSQAATVIRRMTSDFRRRDYARGIALAVDEVDRLVSFHQDGRNVESEADYWTRREISNARYARKSTGPMFWAMGLSVGGIGLMFALCWLTARRRRSYGYAGTGMSSQAHGWFRTSSWQRSGMSSSARSRFLSSGGGGGGYSGGGGRFGGGGASGGW